MRAKGGRRGAAALALLALASLIALGAGGLYLDRAEVPLPRRVGIQAGHWKTRELPDELARFRTSTGASAGDVDEVEINLDVARRVEWLLEARGIPVDLLPSTVPPGYRARAFVSIHADGSENPERRGWKLATPYRETEGSRRLAAALAESYGAAVPFPLDPHITPAMRGYYGFASRSNRHAIHPDTPAVILEMGFVSNQTDRAFLTGRADAVARAVAEGVARYIRDAAPPEATDPRAGP